jgi:hypothetical protein
MLVLADDGQTQVDNFLMELPHLTALKFIAAGTNAITSSPVDLNLTTTTTSCDDESVSDDGEFLPFGQNLP